MVSTLNVWLCSFMERFLIYKVICEKRKLNKKDKEKLKLTKTELNRKRMKEERKINIKKEEA